MKKLDTVLKRRGLSGFSFHFALLGTRPTDWDATDAMGNELSSGVYFARARTSHQSQSIKLIHLK
ncbi:MAG: hypothetical protein GF307_14335 [candidate division Zixibacteria bacterium]|nr:hypothetical protein [candidate division Zixibacteria bacterium]